ncbi:MAG: hypothetical protein J7460_02290, partial [Chloroflexus sp.]|nr:hypothetical protein [Chloroflexus sp.]
PHIVSQSNGRNTSMDGRVQCCDVPTDLLLLMLCLGMETVIISMRSLEKNVMFINRTLCLFAS